MGSTALRGSFSTKLFKMAYMNAKTSRRFGRQDLLNHKAEDALIEHYRLKD